MEKKINQKNGRLTRYGFACGYIERIGHTTLHFEQGVGEYVVSRSWMHSKGSEDFWTEKQSDAYKVFNTWKDIEQCTKEYIDSELKSGMEQIEFDSLKTMIENLGYTLKFDFKYTNKHNRPHIFAVTAYNIIDNKTGKGFANIDSDKTNIKQLQEIRSKYLCVKNTRIVQI